MIVGSPPPDFQSLGMGTVGQSLLARRPTRAQSVPRRLAAMVTVGVSGQLAEASTGPLSTRRAASPWRPTSTASWWRRPWTSRSTRTSRASTRPVPAGRRRHPRRLGHGAQDQPAVRRVAPRRGQPRAQPRAALAGVPDRPARHAVPPVLGPRQRRRHRPGPHLDGRQRPRRARPRRPRRPGRPARSAASCCGATPTPACTPGAPSAGSSPRTRECPEDLRTPVFAGVLGADITFVGFDLGAAELLSGDGWFFVIQEQATEARFGFDELDGPGPPPALTSWSAATWEHTGTAPGALPADRGQPAGGDQPRRRAVRRPRRPPRRAHPPAADAGRHPRRRRTRAGGPVSPSPADFEARVAGSGR